MALDLFTLVAKIGINDSEFQKGINNATSQGKTFGQKFGDVMAGVGKAAVVGLGAAATAFGALSIKALQLGGDLEQNIGGSEAVFKNFAETVQNIGATAFETMGLAQSDFLATANKMGALMQGSGISIEQSMDLSTRAMQRAADVASIMGIDTSAAMESIAGAAKGNFTMMDNLGVAMNATTIEAYALSKGIKTSYAAMDNAQKIGLAMEMFLEKTAYAAGNYAKENETLAGSLSTAKASITNFLSGAGGVDDAVNAIGNLGSVVVRNLGELVPRLVDGLRVGFVALLGKMGETVPALKPVADGILFLAQNMDKVLAVIIPLTVATAAYKAVMAISGIITAVTTALNGMTVAQYALNLAMSLNPIGIVIAAIAALVAGLIVLWNTNEDFRNALINAWKSIKETTDIVWGSIVKFFTQDIPNAIRGIPDVIQTVVNWFSELPYKIGYAIGFAIGTFITWVGNMISTARTEVPKFIQSVIDFMIALPGKISDAIKDAIQKVKDWVSDLISTAQTELPKFVDKVVEIVTQLPGKMLDIGKNIVEGLWNGIKNATNWLMDLIGGWVDGIIEGIMDGLGIESPSKVMAQIGKFTAQGFINGILGMSDAVNSAMESTFGALDGSDFGVSLGGIGGVALAGAGGITPAGNNYNLYMQSTPQSPYEQMVAAQAVFDRARWQ